MSRLLLALQWGGALYPWNDKIIIAMFCVVRVYATNVSNRPVTKPRIVCCDVTRLCCVAVRIHIVAHVFADISSLCRLKLKGRVSTKHHQRRWS
jgi:hypothetical protein